MSKITDDKKLPLGVGIEPSHVAGNIAAVATQLSGNITKDQRAHAESPFSISWFYSQTVGDSIGTATGESLHFTLPPLQDEWNDKLVSDENTQSITLDSISFSFDLLNQGKKLDGSTGLPSSVDMDDVRLYLYKLTNDPGTANAPPEKLLMAEIVITGEEIIFGQNTRNPTILRDLGISIDRFAVYEWHIDSSSAPLISVLIRANFSHPIVQRDTAAVLGSALNSGTPVDAQNAPATTLYNKNNDTVTITAPAADSLIQADVAVTGVQTQIETLDTKFRNKLVGGRDGRYQVDTAFASDRKEQIVEDSGYFCWCVNLMKVGNAGMIRGDNVSKWQVAYPNSGGNTLWDRALIPIAYPGTIHHVFVEAAGINDYIRKHPGAVTLGNRVIEVGVGLYRGVRVSAPSYQQVAHASLALNSTTGKIMSNRLWSVPLVYSILGVAGNGYVTQGRPVYFGRQLTYDGTVARANIADSVGASSAEAAPATGGLENYIEVRLTYTRGTGATWDTGSATDLILSNAGFNVYIIGKMGLKE